MLNYLFYYCHLSASADQAADLNYLAPKSPDLRFVFSRATTERILLFGFNSHVKHWLYLLIFFSFSLHTPRKE